MTLRSFLAAALLFVTSVAIAQPQPLPPGKWWQRRQIVQELALSADQQNRLDAVFRAAANDLIDMKADAEKLQIQLRGELERPQLRRNDIKAVASKLSEARAKLFERELMMLVDMRGVLSDRQWEVLRAVLDRMDDRRPGGPPGGGPPHRKPPA